MYRLSLNIGSSNAWNPLGLSRPVMGLLCLYKGEEKILNRIVRIAFLEFIILLIS
jgi:hypothetical protein